MLRPTTSASFTTLRAKGAFLVTANYDGTRQRVGNVTILSEAGTRLRVLSPWLRNTTITVSVTPRHLDGKTWTASRLKRLGWASASAPVAVVVGAFNWFEFDTEAGATYSIVATEAVAEAEQRAQEL